MTLPAKMAQPSALVACQSSMYSTTSQTVGLREIGCLKAAGLATKHCGVTSARHAGLVTECGAPGALILIFVGRFARHEGEGVLMEATASGLPAVSTEIADIPELVEDRVCGFHTPPGDAESLAGAIETEAQSLIAQPGCSGAQSGA